MLSHDSGMSIMSMRIAPTARATMNFIRRSRTCFAAPGIRDRARLGLNAEFRARDTGLRQNQLVAGALTTLAISAGVTAAGR